MSSKIPPGGLPKPADSNAGERQPLLDGRKEEPLSPTVKRQAVLDLAGQASPGALTSQSLPLSDRNVEQGHQESAESFARAVHHDSETLLKGQAINSPSVVPRSSSSAEVLGQEEVGNTSALTEQAASGAPTPKLHDLITWFQNKRNRYPEEITPGFEAQKSGEFVAFTNARVKSEMVKADGGSNYRPEGHKFEKVHLSIDRNQFGQAWEQVAPLLFSDKNPFLQFKVSTLVDDTLLQSAENKIRGKGYGPEDTQIETDHLRRVSEGLQITFYYTPPGYRTPAEKVAKEAQESASFLKEISTVSQSFAPGKVYGRTMQLSPHIDYREETWDRGDTSKPVEEALSERPFDANDQVRLAKSPFFAELENAFRPK